MFEVKILWMFGLIAVLHGLNWNRYQINHLLIYILKVQINIEDCMMVSDEARLWAARRAALEENDVVVAFKAGSEIERTVIRGRDLLEKAIVSGITLEGCKTAFLAYRSAADLEAICALVRSGGARG